MEGAIRGRGKNKRFWTPQEDETLLQVLLELSRNPRWKSENGFKSGYMNQFEEMIAAKLPNCGLKAEPHIDSRLKHWSEKYSAIAEMLGTSGFGWDDEKKVIQVEQSVYDEWVKTHRKAKGLFGVPFPYYDTLAEIYGKDKATREASESFVQAMQNIDLEMRKEPASVDSDDEFNAETELEQSASATSAASGASRSRKRNQSPTLNNSKKLKTSKNTTDEVSDLASSLKSISTEFGKFFQDMNANLGAMADVWISEEERKKKLDNDSNKKLDELLKLEFLSPSEALEVATMLMAEEHKMRVFFQANTTLKKQYVSDLLKKKN